MCISSPEMQHIKVSPVVPRVCQTRWSRLPPPSSPSTTDNRGPHLTPVVPRVCQTQHRNQVGHASPHLPPDPTSQTREVPTSLQCFHASMYQARHQHHRQQRSSPVSSVSRCMPDTATAAQTTEVLTCLQCFQVYARHSSSTTDNRGPHLPPVFPGVCQTRQQFRRQQKSSPLHQNLVGHHLPLTPASQTTRASPVSSVSRCVPDTYSTSTTDNRRPHHSTRTWLVNTSP